MAIVKTTSRETGSGSESGDSKEVVKTSDPTKSVVNQGGQPLVRPTRSVGAPLRQPSSVGAPTGPKTFVNDTLAELKRVDWPTKEERNAGTIVTIGLLIFFALYITGLDTAARYLFIALGILPPDTPQ